LSDAAADALAMSADVSAVFVDRKLQLDDSVTTAQGASVSMASASDPTAAAFYPLQWNMRAIGADSAWAGGALGAPEVTIAIIDSGIDYTYPDLAGRVDLARSASFVAADDALVASLFPGRHPITDLNGHGTAVAAVASSNGLVAPR
jgi:subtilisin family serine protease